MAYLNVEEYLDLEYTVCNLISINNSRDFRTQRIEIERKTSSNWTLMKAFYEEATGFNVFTCFVMASKDTFGHILS